MGFNPRPSSLTGERPSPSPPSRSPGCFNPRPSSLTGERGHGRGFAGVQNMFQSTPVITDGRTTRPSPPRTPSQASFNPRPSSLTGERTATKSAAAPVLFQSTPVITDGRTLKASTGHHPRQVFQSTPVITDGRTPKSPKHRRLAKGFNPRPSSLTGERGRTLWWRTHLAVSIHARHH